MPTVSIIVPIYNVECYLRACVDSAINQTYADFELILVDDGSSDNCGAICDEYAKKDSRIRVIHKINGGLSDARNAGLDIVVGKYVYFLDADDTIEPNLLETVVPYMEQGADLVAFSYRSFFDNGTVLPVWQQKKGTFVTDTPQKRLEFCQRTLIQSKIGWGAWSRIFSSEKIEQHGLRFADNRKIFAEDLYFNLCYCAHANRILCLPDCLYNYRQREDSIIGSQVQKCNMGRFYELTKELEVYYRQFEECKLLTENFSLLRYQILAEQFDFQLWISKMTPEKFRAAAIDGISDWHSLKKEIWDNLRRDTLKPYYDELRNAEIKCYIRYWLGMPWFVFRMQWKIIRMYWAVKGALAQFANQFLSHYA